MKNLLRSSSVVLIFVAICLIANRISPFFFTIDNQASWLLAVTSVGMIACTMMLCLGAGDVDLSVGSTAALGGVIAAVVLRMPSNSPLLAIGAALGAGLLVGLVNGAMVALIKINPLIATLGTMMIARGAAFLIAPGGSSVGISNESFIHLSKWSQLNMQGPVWYMFALFIIFGLVLNKTVFGRSVLAVGGNQEAARLAGIQVAKVRMSVFALQGMLAALAGVVLASRTSIAQPATQNGLELQVIAGCVLGGVSLTGGIASMIGVVMGVFIMGVVNNIMSLQNVDTYWQYVVFGCVLLFAVILDRIKARA